MTIAAASAAPSVANTTAMIARVQKVYAAATVQPNKPTGRAEDGIDMHRQIVSPQAQIVVQANAISQSNASQYDNRVTGATQNVQSFDRMALVIEGFEHLREIFENVKAEAERAKEASPMGNIQETLIAAGMDVRV